MLWLAIISALSFFGGYFAGHSIGWENGIWDYRSNLGLSFHGCLTGDCPHETQAECDASLAQAYRELADSQKVFGASDC